MDSSMTAGDKCNRDCQDATRTRLENLLKHLQTKFGVEGMPLSSFQSYLNGQTQYVIGQHQSTAIHQAT